MKFRDALAAPGLSAIAEIKRRSPSAGDLRPDADAARIAAAYDRAGAAAISVLVDERFGGSLDDLRAARSSTTLPLLGKGFFTEEDDLVALRAAGADAALILLRDVDDAKAAALMRRAAELGLETLVEAHDAVELERAVALGAPVIGINARDLSTFRIDRDAQLDLVAKAVVSPAAARGRAGFARAADQQGPGDRVVVAESGIHTRAQGAAAELAGADAILVGSALMRAPDPAAKLAELVSRPLVKVCGLTREVDVAAAVDAGADMFGFILAAESPRRAPRVFDVPDSAFSVAVWVGERGDEDADLHQLYARENGHRARHGALFRGDARVAKVVDLPWQSDDPLHWESAAKEDGRVMLAGGLDAANVRAAVDLVRPWAVDAASRLEVAPGIKDHARVRAFVEAAR